MTSAIKVNLQNFNIISLHSLEAWVKQQISTLGRIRRIDAANVRLSRLDASSPAYHVKVQLVTPGPDVFAEGRDHTLRAAFSKVVDKLRQQIAKRIQKRGLRWKTELSLRSSR
ncbi:MAG: HPF/RaiA family ribosome-associated protein [Verrucomicrobiota bacterium]|jgi:ribosome-associated translation inhibitor RaiA